MITLNAELRDVKVNPKMIRKQGKIPAIFYGAGQESTPISIGKIEFKKVLADAGESTIITLKTPNVSLDALIHDVDLHPVLGDPIHVDFYITAKDHKLQVAVPIEFVGAAPAEKAGGVVLKVMHEMLVESLPAKLPAHITVDLSLLAEIGSHITVGDVKLPEGVRALAAASDIIANAALPKEEAETPVAPIDLSSIEVAKKGKQEEDEVPAE